MTAIKYIVTRDFETRGFITEIYKSKAFNEKTLQSMILKLKNGEVILWNSMNLKIILPFKYVNNGPYPDENEEETLYSCFVKYTVQS